ncbi:MAG: CBS domain-containing protein [Candidatus Marinimicrobia bacterium]|nr:CBS domain-containing protein [Candidatus Neomarinimicrobiota bacterium]
MIKDFDDELARMDELERDSDIPINQALSLNDPIEHLSLRYHPSVESGTTLESAIKILGDKKVGCIMIERNSQIIGVMTERDFLLRVTGKGLDLQSELVDSYMTKNPETLTPNDPISYALNKMHIYGIRHIPIINENGKIYGLISVKDIISHLGNYFGVDILNLPPNPSQDILDRPEGG